MPFHETIRGHCGRLIAIAWISILAHCSFATNSFIIALLETKGKEPVVGQWSMEFQKIMTKCENTGLPALLVFENQGCGYCQTLINGSLNTDDFKSIIDSYKDIYLGCSVTFSEIRNFRKTLFKSVFNGYTGYPETDSRGNPMNYLSFPSIVLLNIVGSKTNVFFHIAGNHGYYDPSYDYITCPYHEQIPIRVDQRFSNWKQRTIYAKLIQGNVSQGTRIEQETSRFNDIVREYLNTIVPHGSGLPTTTDSTSETETTYIVYKNTVLCRFEIPITDVLKKSDIEKSDLTNDFIIVSKNGSWFIDQDDMICSSSYGQYTISDSYSTMLLFPKNNGKFHIAARDGDTIPTDIYYDTVVTNTSITGEGELVNGTTNGTMSVLSRIGIISNPTTIYASATTASVDVKTNTLIGLSLASQKIQTFELVPSFESSNQSNDIVTTNFTHITFQCGNSSIDCMFPIYMTEGNDITLTFQRDKTIEETKFHILTNNFFHSTISWDKLDSANKITTIKTSITPEFDDNRTMAITIKSLSGATTIP